MNPVPIILAELRRTRAAAASIIVLVALAVAFGVAVAAQERALRRGSAAAADAFDLVVGAPGSQVQLLLAAVFLQPGQVRLVDGEVLRRLSDDPRVAWASPIGFGDRWGHNPIIGATADLVTRGGQRRPGEGRVFAAWHEVVVGADVNLALGARFTPAHGMTEAEEGHAHEGFEYEVVGRMPREGTPWDRAIVAPIEAVWDVHSLPTGHDEASGRIGPPWPATPAGVPAIVVKPRSVADAYRLRGELRGRDTMAVFPGEVLVELYATLGDARDVLTIIAVATQVLVVAAVLLPAFALLALRRRQIAVLRALGAPRVYVFSAVWGLLAALTACGAAAGLGLGWLGALAFARLVEARTGLILPVALGPGEALMALAVAFAGALLALIPAAATWRAPIAEGLRA